MNYLPAVLNNKYLIQLVSNLPSNAYKHLISLTTKCNTLETCDKQIEIQNLSDVLNLSVEEILDLIGIFIWIARIHTEFDKKQYWEAMISAGFSEDFLHNYSLNCVNDELNTISTSICDNNSQKLTLFKWRIDISFTNRILKKQLPPTIIISLHLNNNRKYTIEIDLNTFHKLRFNISLACKEFNLFKKSNLLNNKMLTQ